MSYSVATFIRIVSLLLTLSILNYLTGSWHCLQVLRTERGKSGFTGVYLRQTGKFESQYLHHTLGLSDTAEEAAQKVVNARYHWRMAQQQCKLSGEELFCTTDMLMGRVPSSGGVQSNAAVKKHRNEDAYNDVTKSAHYGEVFTVIVHDTPGADQFITQGRTVRYKPPAPKPTSNANQSTMRLSAAVNAAVGGQGAPQQFLGGYTELLKQYDNAIQPHLGQSLYSIPSIGGPVPHMASATAMAPQTYGNHQVPHMGGMQAYMPPQLGGQHGRHLQSHAEWQTSQKASQQVSHQQQTSRAHMGAYGGFARQPSLNPTGFTAIPQMGAYTQGYSGMQHGNEATAVPRLSSLYSTNPASFSKPWVWDTCSKYSE